MTSLTRWLLRAFADHWPGGLPPDLYLEDRDDSRVLEADTTTSPTSFTERWPSMDFDMSTGNVLGVATVEWTQNPAGLGGGEYRAEPVLSVRIEGVPPREHGHIADSEAFVNLAQQAEDVVRTEITNGTLQNAPVANFHVAEPSGSSPQMDDYKDAYRYDFDVEPVGYRTV